MYNGGMHSSILIPCLLAVGLTTMCDGPDSTGLATLDQLTALPLENKIEAHFFRGQDSALCIVDEGDGKPAYGSLAAAMQGNACTAGVNGGYFGADSARTPLGLVRHGGKSSSPLSSQGFTVSGILYDTGEGIFLERSKAPSHRVEQMQEAVQGGPFLVENGAPVSGLNNTKKANRTFVATDGKGNWCIAVTEPMTLHELATLLCTPGALGNFHVQTALNLDGGTSSAFWDSANGRHYKNFKPVRNYVGVTPRKRPSSKRGR